MTNNDGLSRVYFNVPAGFRPLQQISVFGLLRVDSSTNSATFPSTPINVPLLAAIGTTGDVAMGLGNGLIISQAWFCGTYVI